jgi:hypothetical protein
MYQPDTFGAEAPVVAEEPPTTYPEELQCANLIHSAPADLDVTDDDLAELGSIHRVFEGAPASSGAPLDDPDTWAVWKPTPAAETTPTCADCGHPLISYQSQMTGRCGRCARAGPSPPTDGLAWGGAP